MNQEDKSVSNHKDQIEALLAAKLDVQNKLSDIFADEHERLIEVLRNMMRIDRDLTAQVMIGPMREVVAPMNKEAQTELLEQIWETVQDEPHAMPTNQDAGWEDLSDISDDKCKKGVA